MTSIKPSGINRLVCKRNPSYAGLLNLYKWNQISFDREYFSFRVEYTKFLDKNYAFLFAWFMANLCLENLWSSLICHFFETRTFRFVLQMYGKKLFSKYLKSFKSVKFRQIIFFAVYGWTDRIKIKITNSNIKK